MNQVLLHATPAHLLGITTSRNNKLLEGHSKLITSWELSMNTVVWNNLKYFDLQCSFKKEISLIFHHRRHEVEEMPKRQDRIFRCFCYTFLTSWVWKQPCSMIRSKHPGVPKATLSNDREMGGKHPSAQTQHSILSQHIVLCSLCSVLNAAVSTQANRLMSPLQSRVFQKINEQL